MGYIEQAYTWSTANVLTAARLNSNVSAIIDGLDAGSKDINIAKLKIAGSDVIDSSQNITNSGDITNSSSTSAKPVLTIKNTHADANSSELQFYKLSASPADNDNVGVINFYGNDDGENKTLFGKILVESTDVTNGTEDGKITLYSMKAGASTASLTISSGAVTCNVSLDIAGSGATVTGILDEDDMSSNSAVKLATQQSIKAYVDTAILTTDTWQEVMTNGNTYYIASNDGNPQMRIGATDAEELHIQTVYDSGAQTLSYVIFQTDVASGTADKGEFRFNVDGTEIFHVNDSGVNVVSGKAFYINDTSVLNATTLGGAVVNSSLTSVGTLTTLTVDDITINGNAISSAGASALTITAASGQVVSIESVTLDGGVVAGVTSLTVDNLVVNGNDISSSTGNITLTPNAGSAVVIDGGASFDGTILTGLTALTSTAITGTLQTAAQANITSLGTLTSLSITGDLTVDTDTLYVDSTNNRIGINDASPETALTLGGGVFTAKYANADANGLKIFQDASNVSKIFNFYSGALTFGTNNTERMRVDSNGDVGIGFSTIYNSDRLYVDGRITAGDAGATDGATVLQSRYGEANNDYVAVLGTYYSTGAPTICYAVRPKSGGVGFVSSADNSTWYRAALQVSHELIFSNAASQSTAVGSDVTLTECFKIHSDGGMTVGAPTGGSRGAGTINAVAVYDDTALLTDYVFEACFGQKIKDEKFKNYKMKSFSEEISFVKENLHLSTIIGREEWEKVGSSSIGKLVSQLWNTTETHFLYLSEKSQKIDELENRINKLEGCKGCNSIKC